MKVSIFLTFVLAVNLITAVAMKWTVWNKITVIINSILLLILIIFQFIKKQRI